MYQPSNIGETYGFAEVKYQFKHRDTTPERDPQFCCVLTSSGVIHLKEHHPYRRAGGYWRSPLGLTLSYTQLKELLLSVSVMSRSSGKRTYCLNVLQ